MWVAKDDHQRDDQQSQDYNNERVSGDAVTAIRAGGWGVWHGAPLGGCSAISCNHIGLLDVLPTRAREGYKRRSKWVAGSPRGGAREGKKLWQSGRGDGVVRRARRRGKGEK